MIAKPAKRLASRLYSKSPSEKIAHFRRKITGVSTADTNQVLGEVLALQSLSKLLAWKLRHLAPCRLVLLGDAQVISEWRVEAHLPDVDVEVVDWDWQDEAPSMSSEQTHLVICRAPTTANHWQATDQLRDEWKSHLHTVGELLLDFTRICELQKKLGYAMKTFDELAPYYLGEETFGPLHELNAFFPLANKRVVEFGCYDGCQTLGLTHLGAEVTAVEARAENALKTRAAADAFGLSSIQIIMDDFHNAVAAKYGRFDLAFAHGVYYHSVAPLTFLQNLVDLSDNVFVGGYCATDNLPADPWESLTDGDKTYRVKPYIERTDYSAGVNTRAYYFHKEDLQAFFARRGYHITVMSDHPLPKVAGCFYRFLARKQAA